MNLDSTKDLGMELRHCEHRVFMFASSMKLGDQMKKMRIHCHEGNCIFLSGGDWGWGVGIAASGKLMAAIPRVSFHA